MVCRLQGTDVNAKDKESRSPLLLAASRGGWRTVNTLIRLGANIRVKDNNTRNVLHLVVMNGGRLDELATTVINVSPSTCCIHCRPTLLIIHSVKSNELQVYF